ncbi:MAG: DegT/DnrJ/EryC1/StrS aminotransferase family protein [Stigonema ocellatum SAG 48.90 = DSM 106950]|nr:DegT/DnrJ/EryC1/StrS aminotransferase family protein [Stigonema ocellatum SAG 48.90 = DSM 106950]
MEKRWEIGSEFDWWDGLTTSFPSSTLLPKYYELFSTGTSVLLSLHHHIKPNGERLRLHLPSFFCMHVAANLQIVFDLCWYRDLPTEPTPDFNSLHPLPGDCVLAVNLFGVREGNSWRDWLTHHDDILLIEDHTHDPFSPWSKESTAHYAMASLRKTLPIPDGAIIWSPQNLELPKPSSSKSCGADQKLTAMLLKRAYMNGANISKETYRILQIQGEEQLSHETNAGASTFTTNILNTLKISELRQRREANIRQFLRLNLAINHADWTPLFTSWPAGAVPFNIIVVCKNNEIREALRKFLISQNIYPTVHWQQPYKEIFSNDSLAINLSNHILTIPSDHRCSANDITLIWEKMTEFSHQRYLLLSHTY